MGSANGIRFDKPLKTPEVAQYLGLSERRVRHMAHDGLIPATKFGRCWYYSPGRIAQLVGMLGEENSEQ
jgi:excisionase family DNA binding protein